MKDGTGSVVKKKRIRSSVTCPWCSMRYERFRSSAVPAYAEAYLEVLLQSREAHARGDYSRNASSRGQVLGYMRVCKLAAWREEHLEWCQMEYQMNTLPTGDPAFFEDDKGEGDEQGQGQGQGFTGPCHQERQRGLPAS